MSGVPAHAVPVRPAADGLPLITRQHLIPSPSNPKLITSIPSDLRSPAELYDPFKDLEVSPTEPYLALTRALTLATPTRLERALSKQETMSQVKNLRAMFEGKGDTSPPDRGRSSGASTPVPGTTTRPASW